MLFRIANLGPICEAELDLSKELLVLSGPNNTGKTYLTWAVYGWEALDLSRVEAPEGLCAWASQLVSHPDHVLPRESLEPHRPAMVTALAESLRRQLPDDFAAEPQRFERTTIELHGLQPSRRGGEIVISLREKFFVTLNERDCRLVGPGDELAAADLKSLTRRIAQGVLRLAFLRSPPRASVFPVERLAINLFARELAANRTALVDDLIDEALGEPPESLRDSLRRRAGRYPRAIRDALQRALRLRAMPSGPYADLADQLEREVLGGKLSKTELDELEFTPDQSQDVQPLGLHQTASVVKSLASLVWHLRYEARKGERLIIDEPELNLHPDNQRRVARVLAKAVNRGLKVMLSTHSDYFVRELNNLIMLSQDSDGARGLIQELGIDPLSPIRPDKLGVYLVHGGKCHAVSVTDTGFEVQTIDEEIHRLNRESQTIYSRLFDE